MVTGRAPPGLPMPVREPQAQPVMAASRSARRRLRRHLAVEARTHDALQALVEMVGCAEGEVVRQSHALWSREQVASVAERVAEFGCAPSDLINGAAPCQRALRELLGSHADYAGEARVVEPLDLQKISLPPPGTRCVDVFEGGDGGFSDTAEGFVREHVLTTHDFEVRRRESEVKHPFMDHGLRRSGRRYARLLRMLVDGGVIEETTEEARANVGVFAVRKRDGRQRLVVDARVANLAFGEPRRTQLPTGAAFSAIEASEEGFVMGGLDLRDFSIT